MDGCQQICSGKTIRSLHADAKGNIWVGTRYSGLVQLKKDSLSNVYTTRIFNRNNGFISDFIKSIDSDEDGNIWVGTSAGIEKLIPRVMITVCFHLVVC